MTPGYPESWMDGRQDKYFSQHLLAVVTTGLEVRQVCLLAFHRALCCCFYAAFGRLPYCSGLDKQPHAKNGFLQKLQVMVADVVDLLVL